MKVRVNGYCRLDNENHRASVSGGGGGARWPTTAAAYLLIESENLLRTCRDFPNLRKI